MPLSISDLEAHPAYFLGPNVMSTFVQAIETGIVINQSFTFWSRAERESRTLQLIVVFVTSVAFLQTSLAFYDHWNAHVLHFNDWIVAVSFIWVDKLSPALTVAMASPVQAFLIWRCWTLTKRSWIALVPLSSILLTSVVTSIVVTVKTFKINFQVAVENIENQPRIRPDPLFILTLSSSAVLDMMLMFTLLVYLSRAKAQVYSSRFRRIMKKLVILIWEAAVPPCVCAILTVVTYLTLVNENYWDLMFQGILGKLYVISLFVTLNGRARLARGIGTTSGNLTSMVWMATPAVRVNIEREVREEEYQAPRSPRFNTPESSIIPPERKSIGIEPC